MSYRIRNCLCCLEIHLGVVWILFVVSCYARARTTTAAFEMRAQKSRKNLFVRVVLLWVLQYSLLLSHTAHHRWKAFISGTDFLQPPDSLLLQSGAPVFFSCSLKQNPLFFHFNHPIGYVGRIIVENLKFFYITELNVESDDPNS
jgi:hypothetical protein